MRAEIFLELADGALEPCADEAEAYTRARAEVAAGRSVTVVVGRDRVVLSPRPEERHPATYDPASALGPEPLIAPEPKPPTCPVCDGPPGRSPDSPSQALADGRCPWCNGATQLPEAEILRRYVQHQARRPHARS